MSTSTIDYDALAKQHGGTEVIDYDALAKEHGGTVVSSGPVDQISAPPKAGTMAWAKQKFYQAVDATANALPAAGATIGAVLGLPEGGPIGAVGGAGIGGMAGAAGRQILRRSVGFESPATGNQAAQDIAKQGAIQGTIQGATEGLGRLAPGLKNMAVKQYGKALAPTTIENKAITQDIAPEMIKRGIYGNLESIEGNAATNIKAVRPQLNAAYANLPTAPLHAQGPISKTLFSLESLKGKYLVDGEVVNPSAVNAIEGVQQIIDKHANTISPSSLRRVKQIFDESVSEAGGYTTSDLTTNYSLKAQKEAANTIRNILHQVNPSVAALDREMSFWLDVQQVTRATSLRRAGQEGGLSKALSPLAMGLAGATGLVAGGAHAGLEAGGTTALMAVAAQVLRSPAWRTASAVAKDRFADTLASGSVGQVSALAARFGVAVGTANAQSMSQQNQTSIPR